MFTPRADSRGYDFTGPTRFDKQFTGIVVARPAFVQMSTHRRLEENGVHHAEDRSVGASVSNVASVNTGVRARRRAACRRSRIKSDIEIPSVT